MANFIKEHPFKLLAVFACPLLASLGVVFVTAGELSSIAVITRSGHSLVSLSMFFAIPIGICCWLISWRMAHRVVEPKRDSDALIEFLLGFGGFLTERQNGAKRKTGPSIYGASHLFSKRHFRSGLRRPRMLVVQIAAVPAG
jgi:hypothetical protein